MVAPIVRSNRELAEGIGNILLGGHVEGPLGRDGGITITFYDQFVMVLGHAVEGVDLVGEILANSLGRGGVILH